MRLGERNGVVSVILYNSQNRCILGVRWRGVDDRWAMADTRLTSNKTILSIS